MRVPSLGFDDLAFAAELGGLRSRSDGLANSVRHEPRRLVSDAQHAMELMRRNTLLARRHQVHCQEPLVQGNMRAFEHRARPYRELAMATVAHEHSCLRLAVLPRATTWQAPARLCAIAQEARRPLHKG